MKIEVQHRDGKLETITLVPPIEIKYDEHLNCFHCGDGTDHFFTPEGKYDGWGRMLNGNVGLPEAVKIIESVESDRDIREE